MFEKFKDPRDAQMYELLTYLKEYRVKDLSSLTNLVEAAKKAKVGGLIERAGNNQWVLTGLGDDELERLDALERLGHV